MPPLLDLGGSGLVFTTFAAFFLIGAIATFGLPERRGEALEDAGVGATAGARTG